MKTEPASYSLGNRHFFLVACVFAIASAACKDDKPPPAPVSSAPSAATVASAPSIEAKRAAPPPAPTASSPAPEQIVCQNILVAYSGAQKSPRRVTRSKEEAKKRAELVASLGRESPEDFDELVKKWSDDPSGERLGSTGLIKKTDVVKPFADAAWGLQVGEVSGAVETVFGFHVIKRNQ